MSLDVSAPADDTKDWHPSFFSMRGTRNAHCVYLFSIYSISCRIITCYGGVSQLQNGVRQAACKI